MVPQHQHQQVQGAPLNGHRGQAPNGQQAHQGHTSIMNEPMVQQAQQTLSAGPGPTDPVNDAHMLEPPGEPKPQIVRGAAPGEPQTVDQWVEALVRNGWDEDFALNLSSLIPEEQIAPSVRDDVVTKAMNFYGNDPHKVRAGLAAVGFVPQPGLPDTIKPKPTGLQVMKFFLGMNKNTNTAQAGN